MGMIRFCLVIVLVFALAAMAQSQSLVEKSLRRATLLRSGFSHSFSDSIDVAWLNHYATDSASEGNDRALAIAIDEAGNVYVTGSSASPFYGQDFYTLKYRATGELVWSARYNGTGNWHDEAQAIAVDGHGSVYVTGKSWGTDSSNDFAVVKYDSTGVQQWACRYDSPQHNDDQASAIAVDNSGNVVVTGMSIDVVTFMSIGITVFYGSAGIERWVVRHGKGDDFDQSMALEISSNYHIYVAGTVQDDFFINKFDQNGIEQWTASYAGTESGSDRAYALALDSSGNIYVGGTSQGFGTNSDYAIVKYATTGQEQWAARFNGTTDNWDDLFDIDVDPLGNAYATGMSEGAGQLKLVTVKFNQAGEQVWAEDFSGTGGQPAFGITIAADRYGNVIVAGYSKDTSDDYVTIKYSSAGDKIWVRFYDGPGQGEDRATALAVDAAGGLYITGASLGAGTGNDYATIKYDSAGTENWVVRHNGQGPVNSFSCAYDVAVDGFGNVYVTGTSSGRGTSGDIITIKYEPNGKLRWLAHYDGPASGVDSPSLLTLDDRGNVYVAGWSLGENTSIDYVIVKYDNTGAEQWHARYNGPGNGQDFINALVVDEQENVYVTGSSVGVDQTTDYATIKYNGAGEEQWVRRYNGPAQRSSDTAYDLAVNQSGEVIVTGSSLEPNTGFDFTTIKYDGDGTEKWRSHHNSSGRLGDFAHALALDAASNIYVTGEKATIKYNAAGEVQWAASSQPLTEGGRFIRLDKAGNVYVLGKGSSAPGALAFDYLLVKFDNDGIEQWHARYDGPGNSLDEPSDLELDAAGNIYVTGKSAGAGTADDFATIKYDSTGVALWTVRFNSSANISDRATALAIDAKGGVYVAGCSGGPNWGAYTTIKYAQAAVLSITETNKVLISDYQLSHNYPNPFNPETKIEFFVPPSTRQQRIVIKIFDITGRLVRVLFDREVAPGRYEVIWDGRDAHNNELASGTYVYRLESDKNVITKKMLLIH